MERAVFADCNMLIAMQRAIQSKISKISGQSRGQDLV